MENAADEQREFSSLSEFDKGVIVGVLIGEGHFGGDGKQPHIALKMHVRRKNLIHWILGRVKGARLFGPYHHQDRHYYLLMVRGKPLVDFIMTVLRDVPWESIDDHSFSRMRLMMDRYVRVSG